MPSFFKYIFIGYRILSWQTFFSPFCMLKMLINCLLEYIAAERKSDVILICGLLFMSFFFFLLLRLYSWFEQFGYSAPGCIFMFLMLGVSCDSWTYRMFSSNLESFQALFIPIIFHLSLSPSLFRGSNFTYQLFLAYWYYINFCIYPFHFE